MTKGQGHGHGHGEAKRYMAYGLLTRDRTCGATTIARYHTTLGLTMCTRAHPIYDSDFGTTVVAISYYRTAYNMLLVNQNGGDFDARRQAVTLCRLFIIHEFSRD